MIYNRFCSIVHSIIDTHVPISKISSNAKYPSHIQNTIAYRNLLWPHIHHEKVRDKFQQCTQVIDAKIKKFLRIKEKRSLNNVKNKYKYVGSFLKTRHPPIPTLFDKLTNVPIISDEKKAQHISKFFESMFVEKTTNPSHLPIFSTKTIDFIHFDELTVLKALQSVKPLNNETPDHIPSIFIKNCSFSLAKPLAYIFNFAMMTKTLPKIWKHSIVTPIPKKPNVNQIENFRPISLLCPISKVFEQIIYQKLSFHLESNGIIPSCQHGFRKNHSVTTQLLSVVDDISLAIENKKCADVIYFDLKNAFNCIPHSRLIEKLSCYGVKGFLCSPSSKFICPTERSL
jgi:hypothetical protein